MSLTSSPTPKRNSLPLGFVTVAEAGHPTPEGLYLAIYREDKSLPIALCGYGKWKMHYDEYADAPDVDDNGNRVGFGWHEETTDSSGDEYTFVREVVAYLPINYSGQDAQMEVLREALEDVRTKSLPSPSASDAKEGV